MYTCMVISHIYYKMNYNKTATARKWHLPPNDQNNEVEYDLMYFSLISLVNTLYRLCHDG